MNQPLISCIVPVYNCELYLREAIDSILAQTYRPLEIFVVDDGSTDGTADVVASYGARLNYLRQGNAGPAAARNRALKLAEGEFVAFLDADDVWHPDKLMRQMACFAMNPKLELCLTYVQNFWIQELKAEKERWQNHKLARPLPGYLIQALLARQTLFDRVGVFDPALQPSEDTDWFLRAFEKRVVTQVVPEVLVYRRLHGNNISLSSPYQRLINAVKLSLDRRRTHGGTMRSLKLPTSDGHTLKDH
jgi:glycosyltransferase involved in cell wall biosynthesis